MKTPKKQSGAAVAALVCSLLLMATEARSQSLATTEFPFSTRCCNFPFDIASGPDGNLWVTARDKIVRVTPSGVMTQFPVFGDCWGITPGPDGNLWFTKHNPDAIGRITTAGAITIVAGAAGPRGITLGPDGNLWFASDNAIGRITAAGVVTMFPTPPSYFSHPYDIAAGSDGASLWYTDTNGRIGRVSTSGTIVEYLLPAGSYPTGITSGPDGRTWFLGNAKIGAITPSGVITHYYSGANAEAITTGPDGALWFSGRHFGRISVDGQVVKFTRPAGQHSYGITTGPDGSLWFPEFYDVAACPGCPFPPNRSPGDVVVRVTLGAGAQDVPTLSVGASALLAAILAAIAVTRLRRRRGQAIL